MTSLSRESLRYLRPHLPLARPFGSDWFGRKAEAFARGFGTPHFLIAQTAVVAAWIAVNVFAVAYRWDPYPFILLNLAFSTQAAYAAPLILLAQTRQADRDKALAIADADHQAAIAHEAAERHEAAAARAEQLLLLLEANTSLVAEVERMTRDLHHGALAERRARAAGR